MGEAVSFDWEKHAECLAFNVGSPDGPVSRRDCNADRAEMIAEGKRLGWLNEALTADLVKHKAEVERLREALKVMVSEFAPLGEPLYSPELDSESRIRRGKLIQQARAALSGDQS